MGRRWGSTATMACPSPQVTNADVARPSNSRRLTINPTPIDGRQHPARFVRSERRPFLSVLGVHRGLAAADRFYGRTLVKACAADRTSIEYPQRSARRMKMRKLLLVCLLALPMQAQAQEGPGRLMLEAGIVGGNSSACPGQYVGIDGRVAGPLSVYGMVETYRCVALAGSANRIGTSVLLGRQSWAVRPAVRAGIEYDGGDVSHTVGGSLTFGRRYGARFAVDRGVLPGGGTIVLLRMGGYISF